MAVATLPLPRAAADEASGVQIGLQKVAEPAPAVTELLLPLHTAEVGGIGGARVTVLGLVLAQRLIQVAAWTTS